MSEPHGDGWVGRPLRRREDHRLLTGAGAFVDDLMPPGCLHVALLRSPHAHARIRRLDVEAARRAPGVRAVVTGKEVAHLGPMPVNRLVPDMRVPPHPILAEGQVHATGVPVAAVVARDVYAAHDALDLIAVDYEPVPAVPEAEAALAPGAPRLFSGVDGNRALTRTVREGDAAAAFAAAAHVVELRVAQNRLSAVAMEPRSVLARFDRATGELTMWVSCQAPFRIRGEVARLLDLPESRVRVIAPDVGGAFGLKVHVFPEDVAVAALARRLGRPVKWIEERREQLTAAAHAREQRVDVELAADAAGVVRGLRARVVSDGGAYHIFPLTGALEPLGSAAILPGPYRVEAYAWEALAVATHKPPLGAYRGVGMTMGAFVMERMLDLLAERLDLDPAEVRRRNVIPRDAYPFTSASGMTYDSGDFPGALDHALALADYAGLRREQAAARAAGRLVGIGVACYTEYTGMGSEVFRRRGMEDVRGVESATVTVDPDGTVRCATSFPSQGQGHATTIAQVVADRLGVAPERVRLAPSDTAVAPAGAGTFGSRGAVSIAGTVCVAADRLRARLHALAAHRLEAAVADVVLEAGRAHVRGFPDRAVPVAELARLAYSAPPGGLPPEIGPGLSETVFFDPPGPTFSGAVHVAQVEVDRETGRVRVGRYVVVEDCGPVVNPAIVEGQIHGAVAQGLGEALLEAIVHDAEGQALTATFMDYALPRADDVPAFEIGHLQTPAPRMAGGVKGMGEGGTIGAPAALANAVADAVRPLGLRLTALPIRADRLLGSPPPSA